LQVEAVLLHKEFLVAQLVQVVLVVTVAVVLVQQTKMVSPELQMVALELSILAEVAVLLETLD
jgi:hypothetical protein